ncbi:MAG TPA: YfhO family protein, partial [Methylomirabilota bacterium]|nr:YfhO family protein [Methylomirabilota bacterium]
AFVLWFQSRYPFPFDYWPAVRRNGLVRVLFLVAIMVAVLLAPSWAARRSGVAGQLAVLLLLVADVVTHVPDQNPRVEAARMAPGLWSQAVPLPPPRLGESRVMISPEAEARLLHSDVRDIETDFLGKRLALWSNLNLLEGLPKVNGSSTLQLREQAQVQALLYPGTNSFTNGLIQFLAVSHRTKPGTVVEWAPWTNAMPLVSCGQRPVFADATNTLAGLVSPDFDPTQIVFLPPDAQTIVQITNRTVARVVATRFAAHRVEVDVKAEEPSLVVVAQSFYHPWRAEVNGAPAPLLRANHAFQAVPVPAGEHCVVLSYRDQKFALGAVISAGTLGVCLIGCCLGRRRFVSALSGSPPEIAAGQVALQRLRSPAAEREPPSVRQP